jgi:hypothetical protein
MHDIKTVPVVRAGDEIIVGFDEARLQQVLGVVESAERHDAAWLASKYEVVLGALERTARQLGPAALEVQFEARRMTVRGHVLHIACFAEGGLAAHDLGTFSTDDMFAATARANELSGFDDVCSYVARVCDEITGFLRHGSAESHRRMVTSHYGGTLSVIELLRIMLRHSTHHLRQLHWFMETQLHISPAKPPTADDLAGITTPAELFDA